MAHISADEFDRERWNHPEEGKSRTFVWVNRSAGSKNDLIKWCEENISGKYHHRIHHTMPKYGVWFDLPEDAVYFKMRWG